MRKIHKIKFFVMLFALCVCFYAPNLEVHAVDNVIKNTITDSTNYIVDETLDGFAARISDMVESAAETFAKYSIAGWKPELNRFLGYFGYESESKSEIFVDYTDFNIEKGSIIDLLKIFGILGYVIATLLFLFHLIFTPLVGKLDIKDSPIGLIVRYIITMTLITFSNYIANMLFNITSNIYDFISSTKIASVDEVATSLGTFFAINAELMLAGSIALPLLLVAILRLILFFVVIKEFIKFAIEIIERYVVACVLYFTFPSAVSTVVSKNTVGIFKAYLKMLISQLILLVMNVLFYKMLILLIIKVAPTAGIIDYFFVIAFLRVAQRIDSYMHALNLNPAVTGGNLMDAALAGLAVMRGMTKGVDSARRGTGELLKTAGINMGGLNGSNAFAIGSALSSPLSSISNIGNTGESMLNSASKVGMVQHVKDRMTSMDEGLRGMFYSGDSRGMLNNISQEALKDFVDGQGINRGLNNQATNSPVTLSDISMHKGEIKANAMFDTESGEGKKVPIIIAPSPSDNDFAKIPTNDGHNVYTRLANSEKISKPNALPNGEATPLSQGAIDGKNLTLQEAALGLTLDSVKTPTKSSAQVNSFRPNNNGQIELYDSSIGDALKPGSKAHVGTIEPNGKTQWNYDGINPVPDNLFEKARIVNENPRLVENKNDKRDYYSIACASNISNEMMETMVVNPAVYNEDEAKNILRTKGFKNYIGKINSSETHAGGYIGQRKLRIDTQSFQNGD